MLQLAATSGTFEERVLSGLEALEAGQRRIQLELANLRAPATRWGSVACPPAVGVAGDIGYTTEGGVNTSESSCASASEPAAHEAEIGVVVPKPLVSQWERSLRADEQMWPHQSAVLQGEPKLLDRWNDLYIACRAADYMEEPVTQSHSDLKPSKALKHHVKRKWVPDVIRLHPRSPARTVWDLLGFLFLLYDIIMMSLEIGLSLKTARGPTGSALAYLICCFWTLDVPLNFITCYFHRGVLVQSGRHIARRYALTWLVPDVAIALLDWVVLLSESTGMAEAFRGARTLRLLRLLRSVRLAKVSVFGPRVEEIMHTYGRDSMLLLASVLKIFGTLMFAAHVLTCVWCFIGSSERDLGEPSWLDDIEGMDGLDKYLISFQIVLGHLTGAPVDAFIGPKTNLERAFIILLVLGSLIVLGYALDVATRTLQDLGKAGSEEVETVRELRKYAQANGASQELSTRVVRFVLDKRKRFVKEVAPPPALHLLNHGLLTELTVCRQGAHLGTHPLFHFVRKNHRQVFAPICVATSRQWYEEGQDVYAAETIGKCLYITVQGKFQLFGKEGDLVKAEVTWFSEVSLYIVYTHQATLRAETIAEALLLAGDDLMRSLKEHPAASKCVFKYAKAFCDNLWLTEPVPEGKVLVADALPEQVSIQALEGTKPKRMNTLMHATSTQDACLSTFMSRALEGRFSTEDLISKVPRVFEELNESQSVYAMTAQLDEQKRCICSIINLLLLHLNRYEDFVSGQNSATALTPELWDQMQHLLEWAGMTKEMLQALMVLLAIRGLGKLSALTNLLPREHRSPERAVLYMLNHRPHLVPSAEVLEEDMANLLESTLEIQSIFNFGQMLQGEGVPWHVRSLQRCIETQGDRAFRFNLVALVCSMCGLSGARSLKGTLFLDRNIARNVLYGIQCLQHLRDASPHAVYWSFIRLRAAVFGLSSRTSEELAVARLACVARIPLGGAPALVETWTSLPASDRSVLVEHFLADGISDVAFVCVFLPQYIANAQGNSAVGLVRALMVLVDVIQQLRTELPPELASRKAVEVDLTDLAGHAQDATSLSNFEPCVERMTFMPMGGSAVRVAIGPVEPGPERKVNFLSHAMKRMARHQSLAAPGVELAGTSEEARRAWFVAGRPPEPNLRDEGVVTEI